MKYLEKIDHKSLYNQIKIEEKFMENYHYKQPDWLTNVGFVCRLAWRLWGTYF